MIGLWISTLSLLGVFLFFFGCLAGSISGILSLVPTGWSSLVSLFIFSERGIYQSISSREV
jgi:hypothetical protein